MLNTRNNMDKTIPKAASDVIPIKSATEMTLAMTISLMESGGA